MEEKMTPPTAWPGVLPPWGGVCPLQHMIEMYLIDGALGPGHRLEGPLEIYPSRTSQEDAQGQVSSYKNIYITELSAKERVKIVKNIEIYFLAFRYSNH